MRYKWYLMVIASGDRVGKWVANLSRSTRERKGWSQAQLANFLGVERETVANWERGAYRPRVDVPFMRLNKLSRELEQQRV